jgi:hypothetical protein
LTITPSGDAVLLAGGIDAFGGLHDDVWRLADAENEPGAVAPMRIAADTTQASRFDPAKTAIVLDTVTETLAAAAFDPTILGAADLRVRTDAGWEAATRTLRPMQCEANDRIGGQRCALGSEWWGSIGRTVCGSSVCEGSRDLLIGQSEMAGPVLAADVDPTSVWLLRTHALERWRVEVDGSTTLAASARLPSTGRDLAVRGASALVASEGGVVLATGTENGFELSSPLELCGKPLRVASLGDELWAVATTRGLTLLAGDVDSPLRVVSTALLVPHGPKGRTETSLNVVLAGSGECENAETTGFTAIRSHGTALAAVNGARLLFASGPLIVDIDTHEPTAPALRSSTSLPQPLRALRVDPLGGRAYGVSSSEKHQPLFDLRGTTLQPAGTHEVGAWVERRDASDLRVRVSGQHAELAKVAR